MNLSTKIPFAQPSIGRKEIRSVVKAMKSGWLTSGKENLLFEKEFAALTSSPYALSVNSATSGLHLALEALGVKAGDKVIVPAYTFTASAEVVSYCGAELVLVDVGEDYNISLEGLEKLIDKEGTVKALIVVHIAGKPCAIDKISQLCRKKKIALIEDCAHAFPVIFKGKALGCWGDAGVFSFYANKTITTGEGGMVLCSSESLYRRMSIMRLHGIDRDIWNRYTQNGEARSWEYDVVEAGFKYNLTNFQAAMGRVQLQRAWILQKKRTAIAEEYNRAFSASLLISCPPWAEEHSWHLYIIRIKTEALRDSLMQYLTEQQIGTSLHFIPLPCLSYYKERLGFKAKDFPQSVQLYKESFSLPIYPYMKKSAIKRIIKAIQNWEKLHG